MQRELCAVLDEVDANPDVRVVVVTGRGRGFCAGADLAGGGDSFDVSAGSPATGGSAWARTATRVGSSRCGSSSAPSR